MTFTYKIPCFDLEQTAGSGQVFRMIPAPGRTNTWQVISQGHVCFIRQENDIFFLECGPDVAFRAKCKMFSRHLQKPILKTEKGRFKGL